LNFELTVHREPSTVDWRPAQWNTLLASYAMRFDR
jgi:hypothetical protein